MEDEERLEDLDYEEFCTFLDSQVFSVHDQLLVDKESYKMYFNKFYTYMKQGFERPEVRTHPIYFRFTSNEAESVKHMQIRHMIVNMIYWYAFLMMKNVEDLNSSHIMDCEHITKSYIDDWINTFIIDPYRKLFSNRKMNHIIEKITDKSKYISEDFNIIMGMSMNAESFINLANKNQRFNEMIHTKLTPSMQPKEIEQIQHNLQNELAEIIKNEPEHCLYPELHSDAGIKLKQLSEFTITGGLKPDVEGNTIPVPINSNFIYGGLRTVTDYYVDAQAGRKSVILNKTSMNFCAQLIA